MSGLWGEHSIFAARIFLSVIQHSLLPIGHRGAEAAEVSSEGALSQRYLQIAWSSRVNK